MNIQKKIIFLCWGGGGLGRGGGSGWGGQGGCELRSEAFVKIPKIKYFFFFRGGVRLGGGGLVGGVRVDVNGEVKL